MAGENINQVYIANPITSNAATDLMYFGQSPYGLTDDAAMTYAHFSAQFGAPYSAAALTIADDTNVTLTLSGTPSTALLEATEITAGWTGTLSLARGGLAADLTASNGGIFYSTASAGAILSGTATAGLALLSGANAPPTWSGAPPITKINVQTFTVGTSTYTPTAGMKFCTTEIVGGGASGGAVTGGTAGQSSAGSGGGGGGYCRKTYTAAQIGATAAVVVGAGGTGASAGANNGVSGGASSFTCTGGGSTLNAGGGVQGVAMSKSASAQVEAGGVGGTATGGDLNIPGQAGGNSNTQAAGTLAINGQGGGSFFSQPTALQMQTTSGNNNAAPTSFGGGSSGAVDVATANTASVAANPGICYITEYISV